MFTKVKAFIRDEKGASAVEYALLLAMVALAVIAGGAGMYGAVSGRFKDAVSRINNGNF
jgi:pilus assembly protein Flp/PilA